MKNNTLYILILLFAFVTACSAPPPISEENQLATVVAGTLTAQPVVFTPIPTITATYVPTVVVNPVVTASGPYYIFTRAQNVNLRIQPGILFQVSRVMPQGTRLQVLGVSPGGEWAYIQNDEGINGWVGIPFVDAFRLEQFPIVEPDDNQLVSGRVFDANGLPISGIGFAFEQTTASKTLRTDAVTDSSGIFYAFLPKKYSGVWTVSFSSVTAGSNAMTPGCLVNPSTCGQPQPATVNVTLPTGTQLNFVWEYYNPAP